MKNSFAHIRYFFLLVCLALTSTTWAQSAIDPKAAISSNANNAPVIAGQSDADLFLRVNAAETLIKSGKSEQAVTDHLDAVIAAFELRYQNDSRRFYAARSSKESLFYMLQAAASKDEPERGAVVVPLLWTDAFYLKAYALIEQRKLQEAKLILELVVEMAPMNSQYLSELGLLFTRQKNYIKALELFAKSEMAAKDFSPDVVKKRELTRAWRGTGYIYIEKNQLDDAEKMYQQCLEIDKEDSKALGEMNFIRNQRLKQANTVNLVN
jgi:tetratricopeptide (TPR) repeat protein